MHYGLFKPNLSPLQNTASTLVTWSNYVFLIGERKEKSEQMKGMLILEPCK